MPEKHQFRTTVFIFLLIAAFAVVSLVCSCSQNLRPTYRYDLNDTVPEGSGQTVKVIILSGQSNAVGSSLNYYLQSEPDYAHLAAGFPDVLMNFYDAASERKTDGFVPVEDHYGWTDAYFGPELGMADALSAAYPGEKIFILKFTYSGAGLDAEMGPMKGRFYTHMIGFINRSLDYLRSKNYNPELVGFCWMQGETDAMIAPNSYEANMEILVKALRLNLDPDLRIFDAAIADNPVFWVHPDVVNQAKQNLADRLPDYYLFDTNAAGFSTDNEPAGNPDRAHYDAHWELVLGRWFGNAIADAIADAL